MNNNQTNQMKKLLLSLACAALAPLALAQTTTTTTTYTDGSGTITEYTPGERVVLRTDTGVVPYRVTKTTTYVTRSGATLTDDQVRARIRIGLPIHIRWAKHDNDMIVDRVIVDD